MCLEDIHSTQSQNNKKVCVIDLTFLRQLQVLLITFQYIHYCFCLSNKYHSEILKVYIRHSVKLYLIFFFQANLGVWGSGSPLTLFTPMWTGWLPSSLLYLLAHMHLLWPLAEAAAEAERSVEHAVCFASKPLVASRYSFSAGCVLFRDGTDESVHNCFRFVGLQEDPLQSASCDRKCLNLVLKNTFFTCGIVYS